MSARKVTEALVKQLGEHDIGLVIANYANADMVGHTGNFEAAVQACEVIDECIGKVVDAAMSKNSKMIITADHGNIEQLIDYDTGHAAHGSYHESGAGDFGRRRAEKEPAQQRNGH